LLIKAFIAYVRAILEYNSIHNLVILSEKKIELLDKVQRRFTKRLQGLKHLKCGIRDDSTNTSWIT